MWKEILGTGGILVAVVILVWIWVVTILRVAGDVARRRLPRLDRLFWIGMVAVLPLVGFVIYKIAGQMEQVLFADLPPKEYARPPVTLTHPPEDLAMQMPAYSSGAVFPPEPAPVAAPVIQGNPPWRVFIVQGPEKGKEFHLDHLPAKMGRGANVEIRLDKDAAISRQHAEFYLWEGTLRVRDLNSRHGTVVRGVLVTDAEVLPGEPVQAGTTIIKIEPEENR